MRLSQAIDRLRSEFPAHDQLRAALTKIYLDSHMRFAKLPLQTITLIHRFVGHMRKTYSNDPAANTLQQFRLFKELYHRHEYPCNHQLHRIPLEIAFGMQLPRLIFVKHCGEHILVKSATDEVVYTGRCKLESLKDAFSKSEINSLRKSFPLPCGLVIMWFRDNNHERWIVYDPETHQKLHIADPMPTNHQIRKFIFDDRGLATELHISHDEYAFSELSGEFLLCRLD